MKQNHACANEKSAMRDQKISYLSTLRSLPHQVYIKRSSFTYRETLKSTDLNAIQVPFQILDLIFNEERSFMNKMAASKTSLKELRGGIFKKLHVKRKSICQNLSRSAARQKCI